MDHLTSFRLVYYEYIALVHAIVALHRCSAPVDGLNLGQVHLFLDHQIEIKERGGWFGEVIELSCLQALAYQAQGQTKAAIDALARALGYAEPQGYVRAFIDYGPPMAGLLKDAAARGIAVGYVARLLAALKVEAPDDGLPPRDAKSVLLVEPLSERELEVLRLVVAGLSNQEIADHLYLALGTVKKHLNNIYGKLGVNRRAQAIAKVRELNLP